MSKKAEKVPVPADTHPGLRGVPMDKIEMYGWEMLDRPGKFMLIPKSSLGIDQKYQRDHVRHDRVNRIAGQWSWVRLGVLSVAERADGTYWVFDGQHRKLAADKRSDVEKLPCMVFKSTGRREEAGFFIDLNSDRGSVQMIDRFQALLAQNDPTAVLVQQLVTDAGYRVARGMADRTVVCVGAIYNAVATDLEAARVAWRLVCGVFDGKQIIDRVFRGLFAAERHVRKSGLGSLADDRFRSAVEKLTPTRAKDAIAEAVAYWGRAGARTEAEGLIRLLNRGRGRNPIPSLMVETGDNAHAA